MDVTEMFARCQAAQAKPITAEFLMDVGRLLREEGLVNRADACSETPVELPPSDQGLEGARPLPPSASSTIHAEVPAGAFGDEEPPLLDMAAWV